MRAIAKSNGRDLPNEVTLKLDDDYDDNDDCDELLVGKAVLGTIIDVLRSPTTRIRLFLMIAIKFLCSIVYYGLSLNVFQPEVQSLPQHLSQCHRRDADVSANNGVIGLPRKEAIGCWNHVAQWRVLHRRKLVGGVGAMELVRMVCGVIGIFGMVATSNLLFIYTAELFPTVVRTAALGCATQAGQMGAILAPLVVVFGDGIPFAVFGVCGLVAGMWEN